VENMDDLFGLILYFGLFFLFIAVPISYYLTWNLGVDPALAFLLGFLICLMIASLFYKWFTSKKLRRLRRI